jgi:hypothetical protein
MQNYDDDYYFIRKEDDDRLPSLTATEETVERAYTHQPQPAGSEPLQFFNGAKEHDRRAGIKPIEHLPDILFNGSFLVVRTHIRDELIRLDVPSLHTRPAIFIGDDGRRHEDYWFLAFSERFDCWDRERSEYEQEALELGGFKMHSIYTYSLNSELLDRVPLANRLLFQMGGTQDAFMVCHKSIASLFRSNTSNGVRLQLIKDY